MAARRRKAEQSLKSSKNVVNRKNLEEKKSSEVKTNEVATLADEHLPPLLLVLVVMACSGLLWVFALRDFLATGRVIAGSWDSAMQVCLINMNVFLFSIHSLTQPFSDVYKIDRLFR
jgi:hypothetical protein